MEEEKRICKYCNREADEIKGLASFELYYGEYGECFDVCKDCYARFFELFDILEAKDRMIINEIMDIKKNLPSVVIHFHKKIL